MLENYIAESRLALTEASVVFDYARATEKLLVPGSVDEGEDPRTGPFMCGADRLPLISPTADVYLAPSSAFDAIGRFIRGENEPTRRTTRREMPQLKNVRSRAEYTVARMAMIYQFELYKHFLKDFDGPYNESRQKKWEPRMSTTIAQWAKYVCDRRNALTHDRAHAEPATMHELLEYTTRLHFLARTLSEIAHGEPE